MPATYILLWKTSGNPDLPSHIRVGQDRLTVPCRAPINVKNGKDKIRPGFHLDPKS